MIPLLISFSGGRTSAFMTRFLLTRYPERETYVVFANTGKERLETLDFINECDKRWCFKTIWVEAVVIPEKGKGTEHKVVTYETASRNGEPFEAVIAKYGITNKPFPHCTRELKFAPIGSYMDSIGIKDYESALGIRSDEPHRINRKRAEKEKLIYPMADEIRVTGKMIRDWWNKQEFDLGIKDYEGNCDMCWKSKPGADGKSRCATETALAIGAISDGSLLDGGRRTVKQAQRLAKRLNWDGISYLSANCSEREETRPKPKTSRTPRNQLTLSL